MPKKDPLGLNTKIDRRDILNSTLLAAGSALLGSLTPLQILANEQDWTGYGGVGDYAPSNGNTWDVMSAGHQIRDHRLGTSSADPTDTGEIFDCVVVGGGISGLAAALFFRRAGAKRSCLVLDNHPIFGGEAKRNEFNVDGRRLMIHQGSAACFPPLPDTFLQSFYHSIGIDWNSFRYQQWSGDKPAMHLETAPYGTGGKTSGFFFGKKFGQPDGLWVVDPWGSRLRGAPISEKAKRELLQMKAADRKPFTQHDYQPKKHGDPASRHLDSITLEQHLQEQYGLSKETIRTFLSPIAGGGSGLGADVLSGYAEYAADVLLPWQYDKGAQMFPGGNAGIARQILKSLLPEAISGASDMQSVCRGSVNFAALDRSGSATRLRMGATVVSVKHAGKNIEVLYTRENKLYRTRARTVVMAGGSWTTKHVVVDLPSPVAEAYAQFHRAPCLMANVAVRHWRFLYHLGLTEAQWFEGIGNSLTMRKVATLGTDPPTINPDTPTVLNLKILFSRPGFSLEEQVSRGRMELLSTSFRDYERLIREQFNLLFGRSGFDAQRDIAGIVLNRWGHAYLSPQPGFFFGSDTNRAPGEVIRFSPFKGIAFANSDLSGIMDHRMSILEAKRAVEQIAG